MKLITYLCIYSPIPQSSVVFVREASKVRAARYLQLGIQNRASERNKAKLLLLAGRDKRLDSSEGIAHEFMVWYLLENLSFYLRSVFLQKAATRKSTPTT